MADKQLTEFLQKLLFEIKTKGFKVRRREEGGIVVYAGEKKITIVTEDSNEQ